MAITVRMNGSTVSGVTWYTMTPWASTVKYLTHEITGADYDVIHVTGLNSASTTVTGYYQRTSTNESRVESMAGQTVSITGPSGTTRSGIVTDIQSALASGGLYVTVSMTVVEQ